VIELRQYFTTQMSLRMPSTMMMAIKAKHDPDQISLKRID
jgi:hypothetical protein